MLEALETRILFAVGVDFDPFGPAPTNWATVSDPVDQTLTGLLDETTGADSGFSLQIIADGGAMVPRNTSPDPGTIPLHANPLTNIGGGFANETGATFVWLGLDPATNYDVFVIGGDTADLSQTITAMGAGRVSFTQGLTPNQLFVNGQAGSDATELTATSTPVTPDALGQITIRVSADAESIGIGVLGMAIQESAEPTGELRGFKFEDLLADGETIDDLPLANWEFYLDANQNQTKDANEITTLTDNNGEYVFSGLAAGDYTIGEDLAAQIGSWIQTVPGTPEAPGFYDQSVTGGSVTEQLNFSNARAGELEGIKWHDLNFNGVFNRFEDLNGNGLLDVAEDVDGDGTLDVDEDLDGDGVLDIDEDVDGDGNLDVAEDVDGDGNLDVAEDVDGDGNLDVDEDLNGNGNLDVGEDVDGDGNLDVAEDVDGDGVLDLVDEDIDGDGNLDVAEDVDLDFTLDVNEDIDGDGRLDVDEDIDGDGILDIREDVDGDGFLDFDEDLDADGVLDIDEDLDADGNLDVEEDLNGNGRLNDGLLRPLLDEVADGVDYSGDSFIGGVLNEDIDGDGALDTAEDFNGDGLLNDGLANALLNEVTDGVDYDGDGFATNPAVNEDGDGDGNLDVDEDLNGDSLLNDGVAFPLLDEVTDVVDYSGDGFIGGVLDEDIDGDGTLDTAEDLNGDGLLNDGIGNPFLDEATDAVDYNDDGDMEDFVNEDADLDGNLDVDEDLNADNKLNNNTVVPLLDEVADGVDYSDDGFIGGIINEDADSDGNLDIAEDFNGDGLLNDGIANPLLDEVTDVIDYDGDGFADNPAVNEDVDGDGNLDVDEDLNLDTLLNDGIANPLLDEVADGIDYSGDGFIGGVLNEDIDGDGRLDVNEDVDGDGKIDTDEDADGDGFLNIDEPVLEGWTIFLDLNGDGLLSGEDRNGDGLLNDGIAAPLLDEVADGVDYNGDGAADNPAVNEDVNGDGLLGPNDPSAVTGPDGVYRIIGVPPGAVTVREVLMARWVQTFPTFAPAPPGGHTVTIESGGFISGLDFGNKWLPLVGVDFDTDEGTPQEFWNLVTDASTHTEIDLPNEAQLMADPDAVGVIDLVIDVPVGRFGLNDITAAPGEQVPIYETNPLVDVGGNFFHETSVTFTWSDLVPGDVYDLFVFGLDAFANSQTVTVLTDGPTVFYTQDIDAGSMFVNREIGDDTRLLDEYVMLAVADSDGQIRIRVDVVGDSEFLGIAGVAIGESAFDAGSISGFKFEDMNASGEFDEDPDAIPPESEPLLAGWTIFIDSNNNELLDIGEVSTATGLNGEYSFTGLVPDETYQIRELLQPGWIQSLPGGGGFEVPVGHAQDVTDIAFGNYRLGTITGIKWHDFNRDGVIDADEPPIEDWLIFLDGTDETALTDENGVYVFEELEPDDYLLREDLPDGWVQTFPDSGQYSVTVESGQVIDGNDFGNDQTSAITGNKWNDLNGNGIRDNADIDGAGFTGIALEPLGEQITGGDTIDFGFTFEFFDAAYTQFIMNEDGAVTFTGAAPFNLAGFPTGLPIVAPFWADVDTGGANSGQIHLSRGVSDRGNTFVQIDWDGVGYAAGNDDLLNEFTLYIENDLGGDLIGFIYGDMQWTTGGTGFGDQGAQIGFDAGDGVNVISIDRPSTPGELVQLNDAELLFRIDLEGIPRQAEPGLVGWTMFLDTDQNGELDPGESFTVTDRNGDYSFPDLLPGDYQVREVLQADWYQTFPAVGAHDLDFTLPQMVTLGDAEVAAGVNFGNVPTGAIFGVKFNDLDGDGVRGPDEPGLDGWTIFIDADGDGERASSEVATTTDVNGLYSFIDLEPGTYRIAEVGQEGWVQTAPVGGFHDVLLAEPNPMVVFDVSFGNQPVHLEGTLVAVDFDTLAGLSPTNWTRVSDESNHTETDLDDENGADTPYDLLIAPAVGLFGIDPTSDPLDEQVPLHPNSLETIGGDFFHSVGATFTWQNLTPGDVYDVYVFGSDSFGSEQTVRMIGGGVPATFAQTFADPASGELFVNDELGDLTRQLTTFAQAVVADETGQIVIQIDVAAETDFIGVAALAITESQRQTATLSGVKFEDLDGDGERDDGEPGLADWTIFADIDDNGELGPDEPQTTTAADGSYSFENLLGGDYIIRELLPADWFQSLPGSPDELYAVTVADGDTVEELDFGNFRQGSISGLVWDDLNRNAVRDRFEDFNGDGLFNDGLANPLLDELLDGVDYNNDGDFVDLVSEDVDGDGFFDGPEDVDGDGRLDEDEDADGDGNLDVGEDLNGDGLLNDGIANVFLNEPADGVDYNGDGDMVDIVNEDVDGDGNLDVAEDLDGDGNLDAAEDLDGDGVLNFDEPGLEDWTVFLDGTQVSTQTDELGRYTFEELDPAQYVVREDLQSRWVQTFPPLGQHVVNLESGMSVTGRDFGNHLPAGIAGSKWNDLNGNGIRDGGSISAEDIQLSPLGDVILERNDDLSTDLIDFGFTFEFFGNNYTQFYINNNGNITFTDPLFDFVPDGFPQNLPIVAPFWADIDTRPEGSSEVHMSTGTSIRGNPFIQVDWPSVGYYDEHVDLLNSFTLYIEDEGVGDIVAFFYNEMQWTTGDIDGANGFGGEGAQIGFDSGDGVNFISVDRPVTPEAIAAFTDTSIVFRVDPSGVPRGAEPGLAGWTIYLDENENDEFDIGERSTITDELGNYAFPDLEPGDYRVRELLQDDWYQSFPAVGEHELTFTEGHDVTLATGELISGIDFGNFELGAILGTKFHDLNENGVHDEGEPGLRGWEIYIDENANGVFDDGELSTTTNTAGDFAFTGLPAGEYRVTEVQQLGWTQSAPGDGVHVVDIDPEAQINGGGPEPLVFGIDFGNRAVHTFGTLVGVDFDDADGTAPNNWTLVSDASAHTETDLIDENNADTPIDLVIGSQFGLFGIDPTSDPPGVQVPQHPNSLANIGGDFFHNASATFTWQDLTPGQLYEVFVFGSDAFGEVQSVRIEGEGLAVTFDQTFTDPDELELFVNRDLGDSTQPLGNFAETIAADANGQIAIEVAVGDGASFIGLAGLAIAESSRQPVVLGGTKFEDLDGDGVRDDGEPGLEGWTIYLDLDNDAQLGPNEPSTVTDADGQYSFTGLLVGDFIVREILQPNWLASLPAPPNSFITVTVADGETRDDLDFGNFQLANLRGIVWDDLNRNGVRDAAEDLNGDGLLNDGLANALLDELGDGVDYNGDGDLNDLVNEDVDRDGVLDIDEDADGDGVLDIGEDADGDGLLSVDEPGLEGWTVFLDGTDVSAVTDLLGRYSFVGLMPGEYVVREEVERNDVQTFPDAGQHIVALESGDDVDGVNFGNVPTGAIFGVKFNDLDGDGVRGPDEPGLDGWTIFIDSNKNTTFDLDERHTVTDFAGNYQFAGLAPDTYTIAEVDQIGWRRTLPVSASYTIAVEGNQVVRDIDFGNKRLPAVSGIKFRDDNVNGVHDPGEPGLAGWTIFADLDSDGELTEGEPFTVTDEIGRYQITAITPGPAVLIAEVLQPGWTQTAPAGGTHVVALAADTEIADLDFGNVQSTSIAGFKFDDRNNNAQRDFGDIGLAGWTIYIDADNSGTLGPGERSQLTDATGAYLFEGLLPGEHVIRELAQGGWFQSLPDPAGPNGGAQVVTTATVSGLTGVNFGNYQFGTISGVAYNDPNNNGVRDIGEAGIAGVTVFVDLDGVTGLSAGDPVTATNGVGEYLFDASVGLTPGNYIVAAVNPDPVGLGFSVPSSGRRSVTLLSGEADIANNFGLFDFATVSGTKWHDTNADGDDDLGELGLPGWTIFIDSNNDGVLSGGELSTVSGPAGQFTFTQVAPGQHTVREVLEDGWLQSFPASGGHEIAVTAGGVVAGLLFGNFEQSTISGTKWNDTNGDGVRDEGELGISGVLIFIDTNDNGVLDDDEQSTVTDENGQYVLEGLIPDTYIVAEQVQAGFTQASPPDGVHVITLVSAEHATDVDFGNFQTGQITGIKWEDVNGDGVLDDDEPLLAGWTIFIDANDNGELDDGEVSAVTDDAGFYSISGLDPGDYTVAEVLQDGWGQSHPNAEAGGVHQITLAGGSGQTDIDFGNYQFARIEGSKFLDVNANGSFDGAEGGGNTTGDEVVLAPTGPVILTRNDDLSTPLLPFNFTFEFFGNDYTNLYINNNGNITFTDPLFDFVPDGFPQNLPIVAPFWADIDTRPEGSSEVHMSTGTSIRGNPFIQVDWPSVGYYDEHVDLLNSFTLYIEDDPAGDIVAFIYRQMQWTTGDIDGAGGFGGGGAQIGFDSGDGENFISLGRPNTPSAIAGFSNTQAVFRIGEGGVPIVDQPVAGVTIYLDLNDNSQLDDGDPTAVTQQDDPSTANIDETGNYMFGGLAPGDYIVREVLPAGFGQTLPASDDGGATPGAYMVTLISGQTVTNQDFGNVELGSIAGRKFHDINGNGVEDDDDLPLAGWTIFLDDNANGVLDDGERSTVTGDDGSYLFDDLAAGTYTIAEIVEDGWSQSAPESLVHVVDLAIAANLAELNFGNFEFAEITGRKFEDLNGNGVLDDGEPALADWTITLDPGDGSDRITTTTDADGQYLFADLAPGTYVIGEEIPVGWQQSLPGSAADPSLGYRTTLLSDGAAGDLDFGNFQLGEITGLIWNDLNADGVRDGGEPGLAGWMVFLDDNANGLLDPDEAASAATTLADGSYTIANVPPGDHLVAEVLIANWYQSFPLTGDHPIDATGSHAVTTVSGETAGGREFGNFKLGSISGTASGLLDPDGEGPLPVGPLGVADFVIFLDENGNGVRDGGERFAMTDLDGQYTFDSLLPGDYTVVLEDRLFWTPADPLGDIPRVVGVDVAEDVTGVDFLSDPTGPDLIARNVFVSLPSTMVPGDRGQVRFELANIGPSGLEAFVDSDIFLSTDDTLDDQDMRIAHISGTRARLATGRGRRVSARVTVPQDMAKGDYFVLVQVDSADVVIETQDANNVTRSETARPFGWFFGQFDGRRNVRLSVNDANEVPVTFSLSSAGVGEVFGGRDFDMVDIAGSTERSSYRMTTRGRGVSTSMGDLHVDGSLRSADARTTDLRASAHIIGTLTNARFRHAHGPGEFVINQWNGRSMLNMSFEDVHDLDIRSAVPISRFTANEVMNTDDVANMIETPFIKKLTIDRNLENSIMLTSTSVRQSISRAKVGMAVNGATITAPKDVGTLDFGALKDSNVYVGVRDPFVTLDGSLLPDTLDDFVQGQGTISRLIIGRRGDNGIVMDNSNVAAWVMRRVDVGRVRENNPQRFGFAAHNIGRYFRLRDELFSPTTNNITGPIIADEAEDFTVQLV